MDTIEEAEALLGKGWFDNKEVVWDRAVGTGLPRLDLRMSGGLPSGVIEVSGKESVGKTLVLGHILGQAQREGKLAVLAQTEYPDMAYIEHIGVDTKNLLYVQGPSVPMMKVLQDLLSNRNVVVGIDSATSMNDETGFWKDWFDNMRSFLRVVKGYMPSGSCLVLTSQARQGKSLRPGRTFRPKTVSASRHFGFEFDARLVLSRENVSENKYDMVVQVEKHPMTAPGVVVDFEVCKGHPISMEMDVLKLGVEAGCVRVEGAMYRFGSTTLGRGMADSCEYLKNHPSVLRAVLDKSIESWRS